MTFAAQDLKDALKGLDSLRYGSLDLPAALRLIVDTPMRCSRSTVPP